MYFVSAVVLRAWLQEWKYIITTSRMKHLTYPVARRALSSSVLGWYQACHCSDHEWMGCCRENCSHSNTRPRKVSLKERNNKHTYKLNTIAGRHVENHHDGSVARFWYVISICRERTGALLFCLFGTYWSQPTVYFTKTNENSSLRTSLFYPHILLYYLHGLLALQRRTAESSLVHVIWKQTLHCPKGCIS